MSIAEPVLSNLEHDPLWTLLRDQFARLLTELESDPRYRESVKRILELVAEPEFPQVELIYVVPREVTTETPLAQKERDIARVRSEIEALRLVIPLLVEDVPQGAEGSISPGQ